MAESQHHNLGIVSLLLNPSVITHPQNSQAADWKPSWRSTGLLHGAFTGQRQSCTRSKWWAEKWKGMNEEVGGREM